MSDTKRFDLNADAYQDISEGARDCWFRILVNARSPHALRLVLGTSLPPAGTIDFDRYVGPRDGDGWMTVSFTSLASTDRVYVRAENEPLSIAVNRS
jgi:hypothetical protein